MVGGVGVCRGTAGDARDAASISGPIPVSRHVPLPAHRYRTTGTGRYPWAGTLRCTCLQGCKPSMYARGAPLVLPDAVRPRCAGARRPADEKSSRAPGAMTASFPQDCLFAQWTRGSVGDWSCCCRHRQRCSSNSQRHPLSAARWAPPNCVPRTLTRSANEFRNAHQMQPWHADHIHG